MDPSSKSSCWERRSIFIQIPFKFKETIRPMVLNLSDTRDRFSWRPFSQGLGGGFLLRSIVGCWRIALNRHSWFSSSRRGTGSKAPPLVKSAAALEPNRNMTRGRASLATHLLRATHLSKRLNPSKATDQDWSMARGFRTPVLVYEEFSKHQCMVKTVICMYLGSFAMYQFDFCSGNCNLINQSAWWMQKKNKEGEGF